MTSLTELIGGCNHRPRMLGQLHTLPLVYRGHWFGVSVQRSARAAYKHDTTIVKASQDSMRQEYHPFTHYVIAVWEHCSHSTSLSLSLSLSPSNSLALYPHPLAPVSLPTLTGAIALFHWPLLCCLISPAGCISQNK